MPYGIVPYKLPYIPCKSKFRDIKKTLFYLTVVFIYLTVFKKCHFKSLIKNDAYEKWHFKGPNSE